MTPRRRFFVLGSPRRAALRAALAQNVLDSQEREQRRSREARALLGDTLPQIEITYLEKNRSTVVRPVLQAISRGRFPDAAAFVTTRAPLGLFVAWRVFPLRCDACVLPEPRGPFCVPWGGGGGEEDDEEEGREAAKARTRGAGQEVEGLHPLRSGDPITRVAWRRFMPHRIPLVRSMTPDTRRHVRLTWDAAARAGDFEATLSQLAVWVLSCRTQGVSFDVDTPAWRGSELRDADCDAALRAFALFPSPTARNLDADIAP